MKEWCLTYPWLTFFLAALIILGVIETFENIATCYHAKMKIKLYELQQLKNNEKRIDHE